MSKSTKTTAIATVNKSTAIATNKTKTDTMLSLNETIVLVQSKLVGTKCKCFTDSKYYVGFGVKCNAFSVNTKKTKYNIYCNDTNFDTVENAKLENVTLVKNGNSSDKTRNNLIETKSTETLNKLIDLIISKTYTVSTDNN